MFTASAGEGHTKSAEAIENYLTKMGHFCKVIDFSEYIHPRFKSTVSNAYDLCVKRFLKVYKNIYKYLETNDVKPNDIITKFIGMICAKNLFKSIVKIRPDFFIYTNVIPARVVGYKVSKILEKTEKTKIDKSFFPHGHSHSSVQSLRDANLKRLKLARIFNKITTIGVITDFAVPPLWDVTDLDFYILANEDLIPLAVKKGIPRSKIRAFGIPIDFSFSMKIDKSLVRKKLGLENKNTVLVMSGGKGSQKVVKIIKELDNSTFDFQIINISGHNKSLKRQVDKLKTNKPIYNYPFVGDVSQLMDASDYIITKPGGLSISESLAKNLSIILTDPLGDQEEENLNFLVSRDAAIVLKHKDLSATIDFLLKNQTNPIPNSLPKPNSTKDLCNFLIGIMKKNFNTQNRDFKFQYKKIVS